MQDSRQVLLALDELAALLEFAGAARFKSRAYERGARVVESLGDELGPLVEQGRLMEVEGIGPTLSREIQELWNTGQSPLLERLRSELPKGAAELLQVPGLTPRRIQTLHRELAIESVQGLVEACRAQQVRGLKGMGPKTEEKLMHAAQRWLARDQEATRILRADALVLAERFTRQLVNGAQARRVELAGAARRGEETVGELDLVVVAEREPALAAVQRLPQVARVDHARATAYLAQGVALSLHFAREASFGAAFVHATGNAAHLEQLVRGAASRGLVLTTEGLTAADGVALDCASERALYEALGLSWVPPELRTGQDELSRARAGGFDALLEATDLRGMVHCHTLYSDGKHGIEEMARAAEAMGMAYITITDHSPSAHYAQGVTLDRLKQQWDEIAEVQERVAIRILRGTESDILADGNLDYPDALLEQFDVVIASIHARHRMDREAMTARLVRALSLPLFKIWGHALGRILLHREPVDCDLPRVLDALAGSRGAIELNADPHRLDLPPSFIPMARARGIPFVVSVDAHSTRGLGVLHHGVTMARRGALTRNEVLNTLEPADFAARVRPV